MQAFQSPPKYILIISLIAKNVKGFANEKLPQITFLHIKLSNKCAVIDIFAKKRLKQMPTDGKAVSTTLLCEEPRRVKAAQSLRPNFFIDNKLYKWYNFIKYFFKEFIIMKEPMIWSYFLQLSFHMWNEPGSRPRGMYLGTYNENNEIHVETWDKLVQFVAERKFNMIVIDIGDGVKYDSHPEISAPDAWEKDFLKKKLDEMRALGLEPIPKLNFSTCHAAWMKEYRRMVSTPVYYKVCADLIAEVCELFGYPRLFHLGLDEENFSLQRWLPMVTIRQGDLLWHDNYFLFKECEKHGARPWVWSDYYWSNPQDFEANMPKSVLQSNWYYHLFQLEEKSEFNKTSIATYEKLDALGYDQVPTASACWHANGRNALQTLAFCKERLSEEHLKGFITVPWIDTKDFQEFALKNDAHALYYGRQLHYPETL